MNEKITLHKKKVLYDGTCPMCTTFADSIQKTSKANEFEFIDIYGNENISEFKHLPLDTEIHVISEDGTIVKNAHGILSILATYKYFGWLAFLGKIPGVSHVLTFLYNRVARNRYLLSKKLFWSVVVLTALLLAVIVYD